MYIQFIQNKVHPLPLECDIEPQVTSHHWLRITTSFHTSEYLTYIAYYLVEIVSCFEVIKPNLPLYFTKQPPSAPLPSVVTFDSFKCVVEYFCGHESTITFQISGWAGCLLVPPHRKVPRLTLTRGSFAKSLKYPMEVMIVVNTLKLRFH